MLFSPLFLPPQQPTNLDRTRCAREEDLACTVLTCGAHVEYGDLPEVGAGLEGGQDGLSLVRHHLQPPARADVHLLADLACERGEGGKRQKCCENARKRPAASA